MIGMQTANEIAIIPTAIATPTASSAVKGVAVGAGLGRGKAYAVPLKDQTLSTKVTLM